MKTIFNLSSVTIIVLLLSSCYSSREFIDDDVYVLKNNKLPIGESLTDETSYATYKHRKNKENPSDNYYREEQNYLYDSKCNHLSFDPYGCGCSYYAWNMYSNYRYSPYGFYSPSLYYGHGFHYAFGNYVYDPFTGMYFYNPYYNPYDYYYGGYYNPYYYSGYNYGTIVYTTPSIHTNQHQGPRTSISGFGNPSNRSNPILLKSAQESNVKPKPHTVSTLRDRPIGTREELTRTKPSNQNVQQLKPVRNISTRYTPSGESRNYPGTFQTRPSSRPVDMQQRPQQNRNINQPRPNREVVPRSPERERNPGENRPKTPSGRRN